MAYRLSGLGESKETMENYEIDHFTNLRFYDGSICEQLFAEDQTKRYA